MLILSHKRGKIKASGFFRKLFLFFKSFQQFTSLLNSFVLSGAWICLIKNFILDRTIRDVYIEYKINECIFNKMEDRNEFVG